MIEFDPVFSKITPAQLDAIGPVEIIVHRVVSWGQRMEASAFTPVYQNIPHDTEVSLDNGWSEAPIGKPHAVGVYLGHGVVVVVRRREH